MKDCSKFSSVPVEEDAIILGEEITKLGVYDVMHQVWAWDGVTAESYIFCNKDVVDLDDDEIKNVVAQSPRISVEDCSLKRSDSGYTFVNFNAHLDS